ncbi:MAG: flagellar biosynthesis anti-sigma factor FlgM [Desulfobacterales bacterium]|nr:MAG: flagellar biosynthesis anti-sigma factor FlgM [Desulfobacterales bacterium]
MEISSKTNTIQIDAYVNQVQDKNKAAVAVDKPANSTVKTDKVEISETAKRMQEAKKQLEALPEVRKEKVAELKNQIENGTYERDAEKIADKMLKESLSNDLL